MKILVLNCGSSSLKYKLFEMPQGDVLAQGLADRIGFPDAVFRHKVQGREPVVNTAPLDRHHAAVEAMLGFIMDNVRGGISGIGHRVVHGGEHFRASVRVDARIRRILEDCKPLAPLHNPPNLMGIDVCAELLPAVTQVAVFDTAFHQTIPDYAYTYAIPYRYYTDEHVRRYGFHGISHQYVAGRTAELLKRPLADLRIMTCHLGAGSSLCAVANGKSVDTSMGFTPLSGLVMATRCGDIDPALVAFLAGRENMSPAALMEMLNRESGVLGISGVSSDFRDLEAAASGGHTRSRLALNVFAYSVARGIGSLLPALGGLDALVFTAGIGENSAPMRRRICALLAWLGVELDEEKNLVGEGEISRAGAPVKVLVVPTNEEKMIAWETQAVLDNHAA